VYISVETKYREFHPYRSLLMMKGSVASRCTWYVTSYTLHELNFKSCEPIP